MVATVAVAVTVTVAVVVVVAGVISVGHDDDEDVHGGNHVNDHDHHPTVPLGASVRRGKVSPCAAFGDVEALVAG